MEKHGVETSAQIVGLPNHPKCVEIKKNGYEDDAAAERCVLVYSDLAENKGWWNVVVKPCDAIQRTVILGQKSLSSPVEVVLPTPSTAEVSFRNMAELVSHCKECFQHSDGVTLAFVGSDSSVVYYKLSDGPVPPESPEEMEKKKKRQKNKYLKKRHKYMKYSQVQEILSSKHSNTADGVNNEDDKSNSELDSKDRGNLDGELGDLKTVDSDSDSDKQDGYGPSYCDDQMEYSNSEEEL